MKKGFTLIELLAVIVILAIIALIATPIILGIIDDARIGSIEASANGYIDAIEYENSKSLLNSDDYKIESNDVESINNLVKVDGEKPDNGFVLLENGRVTKARLDINGYTVYYDGKISKVIGSTSEIYTDSILNGADPVLKDELVAVIIDQNGKVKKADTTKEWYNYKNKEWANAVILFEEDNYKPGELIDESDIKEYYVWIPRYAYKLWNVNGDSSDGSLKPIEIVFGSEAKTTGKNNGDMYLHPAFTNFNTYGIWVAKFKLSYNEETYVDNSIFKKVNPNYLEVTDSSKIIIKPNVRMVTNKTVSELFTLLYNSHRNLNSHMMTNMEWGAAAYLTTSIYGRCDNETCVKINRNNTHSGYLSDTPLFEEQWQYGGSITGCSETNLGDPELSNVDKCINDYNTEIGHLASTTGNITGIYDMSGGNWNAVMGVLVDENSTIYTGYSGYSNKNFSGFKGIYGLDGKINTNGMDLPNSKYYNTYKINDMLKVNKWNDYSSGLLGDATIEVTIPKADMSTNFSEIWFKDHALFVFPYQPWFKRGASGIFSFGNKNGGIIDDDSTRPVLAF